MNAFRGLVVFAAIAATTGCGFALRPFPLNATPADWKALDGEWHDTVIAGGRVSVCEDGVARCPGVRESPAANGPRD